MSNKDLEWSKIRTKTKQFFLRYGIDVCELRLEGCTFQITDFAHSKKRWKMGKWESIERELNMNEVVGSCRNCHNAIEGKKFMEAIVKDRIGKRNKELSKWLVI